jgi:hypothetical protein
MHNDVRIGYLTATFKHGDESAVTSKSLHASHQKTRLQAICDPLPGGH